MRRSGFLITALQKVLRYRIGLGDYSIFAIEE